MGSPAGIATKPRRSGRATRQTSKNQSVPPDVTDADTKFADPPKKRRKVAKPKAATAREDQPVGVKPRRRAGKLSNLLDMPIDILYEVCGAYTQDMDPCADPGVRR